MIAVHIYETDKEIIVSKLDCVIARFDKWAPRDDREIVWFLEEVLVGLGEKVEVE